MNTTQNPHAEADLTARLHARALQQVADMAPEQLRYGRLLAGYFAALQLLLSRGEALLDAPAPRARALRAVTTIDRDELTADVEALHRFAGYVGDFLHNGTPLIEALSAALDDQAEPPVVVQPVEVLGEDDDDPPDRVTVYRAWGAVHTALAGAAEAIEHMLELHDAPGGAEDLGVDSNDWSTLRRLLMGMRWPIELYRDMIHGGLPAVVRQLLGHQADELVMLQAIG